MTVDILFLAWNRLRFTRFSISALLHNTNWAKVRSLWLYDDGSEDGTLELMKTVKAPCATTLVQTKLHSPVAIMNDFLQRAKPEVFAKIDNDVVVPPLWLEECTVLMKADLKVDILGIEPMHEVVAGPVKRECIGTRWIGGIGLMRSRVFTSLPVPNGRFGFTTWQKRHADVAKMWIKPALPVILLNRVPVDPWCTLSAEYGQKGWQRPWIPYSVNDWGLWDGARTAFKAIVGLGMVLLPQLCPRGALAGLLGG